MCHLGILLLILGFTLGQLTHREWTVYGVPGDTKPIGDTGYFLTIDDFEVWLREEAASRGFFAGLSEKGKALMKRSLVKRGLH